MRRYRSDAIVLRRVNYGEADRIVTFLTKQQGLVSAMVKGARKQGNKLAGGIELFSICDITFLQGKGDLDHVISARMSRHFSHIITDYPRVELGYEAIKQTAKAARQFSEPDLYELLEQTLESLDNLGLELALIDAWFELNLLALLGQQPNLTHDVSGVPLTEQHKYTLLPDDGAFREDKLGQIEPQHIKAWRVLLKAKPTEASAIKGVNEAVESSLPALKLLFEYQLGE